MFNLIPAIANNQLHVYVGRDVQVVWRDDRVWRGRRWRWDNSAGHCLLSAECGLTDEVAECLCSLRASAGARIPIHLWVDLWPVQVRALDVAELNLPSLQRGGTESWNQTLSDRTIYEVRAEVARWDALLEVVQKSGLNVVGCLPLQWLLLEAASRQSKAKEFYFVGPVAGYRVYFQWDRWHVRTLPGLKAVAGESVEVLLAQVEQERERSQLMNEVLGRGAAHATEWRLIVPNRIDDTHSGVVSLGDWVGGYSLKRLPWAQRWTASQAARQRRVKACQQSMVTTGLAWASLGLILFNLWSYFEQRGLAQQVEDGAVAMEERRELVMQWEELRRSHGRLVEEVDRLQVARGHEQTLLKFFWFVHNGGWPTADLQVRSWHLPAWTESEELWHEEIPWLSAQGDFSFELEVDWSVPERWRRTGLHGIRGQIRETLEHWEQQLALGSVELGGVRWDGGSSAQVRLRVDNPETL